ncbi:hypothetical protein BKA64DRAFT_56918 [Cadophora sp. MPI-SDFR-AT-0126]|nr:hypothetical protein BKA64DRAFT_56918 [Leotiomycetes sp. MPI-SDFR-AT-0126]
MLQLTFLVSEAALCKKKERLTHDQRWSLQAQPSPNPSNSIPCPANSPFRIHLQKLPLWIPRRPRLSSPRWRTRRFGFHSRKFAIVQPQGYLLSSSPTPRTDFPASLDDLLAWYSTLTFLFRLETSTIWICASLGPAIVCYAVCCSSCRK